VVRDPRSVTEQDEEWRRKSGSKEESDSAFKYRFKEPQVTATASAALLTEAPSSAIHHHLVS